MRLIRTSTFEVEAPGWDRASMRRSISSRLVFSMGKDPRTATARDWFQASALAIRDRLVERWMATMRSYYETDRKRVYYLSLEFLTGRLLSNSLLNLGLQDAYREALSDLELAYDEIRDLEPDAALGNGGLGRLAACLLDSMATLSLPGYGYGIRYEFGLFFQRIEAGAQVEHPDAWLRFGNPWELHRPEVFYPVRFGGRVIEFADEHGRHRCEWVDAEEVMAMAFDTPVPGFGTGTVNNLRLWSAKASRDFNLSFFNEGNYIRAVEEKTESENLSKVLYPDDSTQHGRELRLKQQYFFVSASLQDIVRRYQSQYDDVRDLPDHVAIQLNDTHPSIAVAELMRLLVDRFAVEWEQAWDITRRTFAYTNHTLMPEALETWPVPLFERLLPRHLQIIYEINRRFLGEVARLDPGNIDRLRRMSIIDERACRFVRMAHLAAVGSHRINGVSQLHTDLMRTTAFADFHWLRPEQIVNVTNGVTPRRWLQHANPGLASLITRHIGPAWTRDLSELVALGPLADDPHFRAEFRRVKHENKMRLAAFIWEHLDARVDPTSLFDVQIKRIHEYKRQLLNVLHVVSRYARLRDGLDADQVARTVIFSGKAAPGYWMAKQIIRLIHAVADVVNHDPAVGDRLRVVFIPNYSVSNAERIVPACDLSEQISTAGTEASGTGNMKLALNGALTIGTLDGANVEMRQAIGEDHFFTFGMTAAEVDARRAAGYDPSAVRRAEPDLDRVLDMIASGHFSPAAPDEFRPVIQALTDGGDPYFVLADYVDYVGCQQRVDALYRRSDDWDRSAILNIAGMGSFSSDRAVLDYAREVWGVGAGATSSSVER